MKGKKILVGTALTAAALYGGTAAASDYPPDAPPPSTVVASGQTNDTPAGPVGLTNTSSNLAEHRQLQRHADPRDRWRRCRRWRRPAGRHQASAPASRADADRWQDGRAAHGTCWMTTSWSSSLALIAGLVAAMGPAEPTGHPAIDAVLLVVGTGLIVLIGALAPWWVASSRRPPSHWRSPSIRCSWRSPSSPSPLALWNGSRPTSSRVVMAVSFGPVVQRPRPCRGRRDARHLGDRHVRRRVVGLRHRYPPSFDAGPPTDVGRARGRRGVHRTGDGRLRLRSGRRRATTWRAG